MIERIRLRPIDRWLTSLLRIGGAVTLILAVVLALGFAQTRSAPVLYLDLADLNKFDFGVPGFQLTPVETESLRRLIRNRVEQDFAGWQLRVTTEAPARDHGKTIRFLRPADCAFLAGAIGQSMGFWTGIGYVSLGLGELDHLPRNYALQIALIRRMPDLTPTERTQLIEARLQSVGQLLGAAASHEAAHSFGVIGHYGDSLMAAAPRLERGFDRATRIILGLSLEVATAQPPQIARQAHSLSPRP